MLYVYKTQASHEDVYEAIIDITFSLEAENEQSALEQGNNIASMIASADITVDNENASVTALY
jgi:hypothetical protein